MSLGEAFVEVHADMRPFGRELRRNVKPMVEVFERELNNAVGKAASSQSEDSGRRIGDRIGKGLKKSLAAQMQNNNIFLVIASSLASAVDDGISALPTEVKAALVAGVLAASPLVAGALSAAVAAGIGVALVGLGVLLASQFEQVQSRAVEFGRNVRESLVDSAQDFVPAIFNAFDVIETRLRMRRGLLDEIFNVSSNFLEPLVQGALNLVDEIIGSIGNSLDDLKPFVDELGSAFALLGDAVGDALEILVATGEDGQEAFRDLILVVGSAVVALAGLLFILTKVYGATRDLVKLLADIVGPVSPLLVIIDSFLDRIDRASNANKSFVNTNTDAEGSFEGLIKATKGQTDELKEYAKAIEDASKAAKNQLDLNISWEESLDRIAESLKENGDTLDITNEKGRENAREFSKALDIAEERAVERVRTGQLTTDQALAQYDAEIGKLRQLANNADLSQQEFNDLFSAIIETSQLRISSSDIGIDALASELGGANAEASQLYDMLKLITGLRRNIGAGAVAGVRGFAEGGMHYLPELVRVAEDGPEVTIPLTKPARAAQLMRQSGLDSMFGGSGSASFAVYIGNEQLDSRVVRIVETSNGKQALALNHGGRGF
jgi:hypothetical protein